MTLNHEFKSLPTRERILTAAKHLFQRRGYYAVGTAEILDAAGAPKGSMYHHFPDGKEQIAIEAVNAIRDDVLTHMRALRAKGMNSVEVLRALAKGMARWLKESEWREGTMLASTTVGAVPELPKLHKAIRAAFAAWRQEIANYLEQESWSKTAANSSAHTLLAAIEGAMILARIEQDERIVVKVADQIAALFAQRLRD